MLLFRAVGNTALFTFAFFISPLLIVLYLLCWMRATVTSIIYGYRKCTLLTGMDAMSATEFHSTNSITNVLLISQDDLCVKAIKEKFVDKVINATDGKNRPLFPKFTRCLSLHAGYLMWSEVIDFSIDDHVQLYHGQPPHNEAELKMVINNLCNTQLPPSRPCWKFITIPLQYEQTTEDAGAPKTCILIRSHHAIADGIAFSRILFETIGGDIGAITEIQKQMSRKFKKRFRNKFMKKLEMFFQIAQAVFFAPAVRWKFQFNNDRPLPRSSRLSGIKIHDWSSPIKLSIIKEINNANGTTVNDVITSCLAGALRKVLVKQGCGCPPQLHTLFVVSLHNPYGPIEATNNFVLIYRPLPTGDMGCMPRLKTTKAIMDNFKRSSDVMVFHFIFQYMCGTVPHRIVKRLFERTHKTLVLSNFPGPSNKLYFIGQIDSVIPLPQIRITNDIGVVVYSYCGHVTVSVTVDTAVINHKDIVRLLLKEFVEEIQQLHSSINV